MENLQSPIALGRWLRKVFQEGLAVDSQVEAYMASTFGTTDLQAVLATADSSEIDSLMELLFYPDAELQTRYEATWGHAIFNAGDPAQVVACLENEPVTAALLFPGRSRPFTLHVPPFALTGFVQRLNIAWQPPADIEKYLEKTLPPDQRLRVRVHLRNTQLHWSGERIDLVCLFLEKLPADDPAFYQGLAFILRTLWALEPGVSFFDFFIGQKYEHFQMLCNAEAFERRRQAANMEILMLQGDRAAYGDIEDIKARMRLIDTLCNAMFGRTRFFSQPAEHHITLDDNKGDDLLDSVFKTLI